MTRYSTNRNDDLDDLLDDLEDDFRHNNNTDLRVLMTQLQARVEALEQNLRDPRTPTGQPPVRSPRQPASATAAGEDVLAKAVGAFNDPEALLAYADRTISDPTVIGVVSGHISAGDMRSAKQAVLEHVQRGTVAAKAEDLSRVVTQATGSGTDDDLANFDSRRAVSEMTERFGSMERLVASLEARLTQLERRPQAAPAPAPVPAQTVAKASGGTKRSKTPEETAEELLSQIDAYIDSPSVVGQLSSMVHAGKFAEVRRVLAGAKRSHDAQRLVQERKSWGG